VCVCARVRALAFLPSICFYCSNPDQIKILSLVYKELEMVNCVMILDYALCQPIF
jgi:hypothetical protein